MGLSSLLSKALAVCFWCGAAAQGIFGPPMSSTCPFAMYDGRAAEVQEVCCQLSGEDCATGLPEDCNIDCAIVFMDFFADCESFMTSLIGAQAVQSMSTFNQKCLANNDVPTLLAMIQSMSEQGCTADATLGHDIAIHNETEGFGAADGMGHFSVEVGQCPLASLEDLINTVDRACCNVHDRSDVCSSGSPTACDVECAIHYVPFYEDCHTMLGENEIGGDPAAMSYSSLYEMCMTNARRDASGLMRSMYQTNLALNSEVCPVEGSLDFFGDCPQKELDCVRHFIGVDPDLAVQNVYQFYRFKFLDNWGATQNCIYEIQLRGPNNCIHDTRDIHLDMERHYADSTQTDSTGYSWRHYTDNCQSCLTGNTNSYGPDNLFDDPMTDPPAGGAWCSDAPHITGWVAINMTVPTMITACAYFSSGSLSSWHTFCHSTVFSTLELYCQLAV